MSNKSVTKSSAYTAFKAALRPLVRRLKSLACSLGIGRMVVYLGDHLALTTTIYGQKIFVDTRDMSLAPHILLDGYWEQSVTNVFRRQIRPGMRVIDIGANCGWYSLISADLIGPSGHLTSFEANPAFADLVYRSLSINGLIDRATVESKAVFSESTVLKFKLNDRFMGNSSIFSSDASVALYKDKLRTIDVESVSLDEYFPSGSPIDFIRIDAEGAEPYIFKGARRLLTDNRDVRILMEFVPKHIVNSYGSVEKFYGDIAALGFSVSRIMFDSKLIAASAADLSSVEHCDVLLKR